MASTNQNTQTRAHQANQQSDRQQVPPMKQDNADKSADKREAAPQEEAPLVTPAPAPAQPEKKAI
ncbi:hypothetical protein ACFONL_10710 [Camelimonas fluminis]|uniref:Uncharacterized protein n=1 Tax=Camelimonas fluminis TaxID=1576911 RepID=A0ABV7UH70_9HYPH